MILQKLIQTLTPTEKKYISKFLKVGSKNNKKYLEAYKKILKGEKISSRQKEYLLRLISRALNQYNKPLNKPLSLEEKIDIAKLLAQKTLFKEAIEFSEKIVDELISLGKYSYAIYLLGLNIKWKLSLSYSPQNLKEAMKLMKKKNNILILEYQMNNLRIIVNYLAVMSREIGFPRSEKEKQILKKFLNSKTLKTNNIKSQKAISMIINTKAVIYTFLLDFDKSNKELLKLEKLLNTSLKMSEEERNYMLLVVYTNIINNAYYTTDKELYLKYIEKILSLIEKNEYLKKSAPYNNVIVNFIFFIVKNLHLNGMKIIAEKINEQAIKNLTYVEEMYKHEILLGITIIHFFLKNEEEALKFIQLAMEIDNKQKRRDMKLLEHLIYFLIILETKDNILIKHAVRKLYLSLLKLKDKEVFPIEIFFCKFIRKLNRIPVNEIRKFYETSYKEFIMIFNNHRKKYILLSFFPLEIFFKSYIENVDFRKLLTFSNDRLPDSFIKLINSIAMN